MCFSPYSGTGRAGGGGGLVPKGLVHNLLFPGTSKIRVSETYFFDTVIT